MVEVLQGFLLQVEVAKIVAHEADEPKMRTSDPTTRAVGFQLILDTAKRIQITFPVRHGGSDAAGCEGHGQDQSLAGGARGCARGLVRLVRLQRERGGHPEGRYPEG